MLPTADSRQPTAWRGITLVEMLVAMAITLVMMAAVVTLFANVSNSVRNRRASVELGGQLRQVRNMLQADLAGATCPGLTWQRPDHNRGYIEIIEGQYRDYDASALVDGQPITTANPEIDHETSIIPASNLPFTTVSGQERWVTDGAGLGDYDDILMLTVRNENEPFVGRVPQWNAAITWDPPRHTGWSSNTLSSPLAEVVWFAVENPAESAGGFFGEPGMRTIYRRALLIAPWLDPYAATPVGSKPGIVRDFPDLEEGIPVEQALAELIAFQDQYDVSVRMERYTNASGEIYTRFVANTLGDLTKRENRYEHHFLNSRLATPDRQYPYAVVSAGSGYSSNPRVEFVPAIYGGLSAPGTSAQATANSMTVSGLAGYVLSYTTNPASFPDDLANTSYQYQSRPLAYVDDNSTTVATARAILNDEGEVVHVVHGLAPLWGARRGEDVMLSDALAFDLRVYDPGAPLFGVREVPGDANSAITTVLEPGDPGWWKAYQHADNMNAAEDSYIAGDLIGHPVSNPSDRTFPFIGQGAYADLGYGFIAIRGQPYLPLPGFATTLLSPVEPWFFDARRLSDVYLASRQWPTELRYSWLAPGYAVYDTWSFHYENNGLNEDALRHDGSAWVAVDDLIDEGTNGFDDVGSYSDGYLASPTNPRLGVDDVGERETVPPYDRPLRGVQVTLRVYERDSRQMRQMTVRQQFMPE